MSGVTTTLRPRGDQHVVSATPGDTRPEPGLLETVWAGGEAARADTTGFNQERREAAYAELIEELGDLGYPVEQYVFPSRAGSGMAFDRVYADALREKARGRFPDLPDNREAFEQQWMAKARANIARAEDTAERGNAAAAFLGGMGGAMTDPVNLMTLPVGGAGRTIAGKVIGEALANMAVEAALQPTIAAQREDLGRRDLTLGEAAQNVAFAGAGAAAIRGGFEIGAKATAPVRERFARFQSEREMARALAQAVPEHLRTPEQQAALHVLEREAGIDEASPYVRTIEGDDAHRARLGEAARQITRGGVRADSPADFAAVKAAIRGPESSGDDFAVNAMGSSASGRYQFIAGTFKGLYRKVYGASAREADRAWRTRRFEPDVQERLMDQLLRDNSAALRTAGVPVDQGNLYVAHVLGADAAVKFIRAAPDTPVSRFVSAEAIRQNPTYFGGGKSVSEALAVIRGKVGGDAGRGVPANGAAADVADDPMLAALAAEEVDVALARARLDEDADLVPRLDAEEAGAAPRVELDPEIEQRGMLEALRPIVADRALSLNRVGELADELGVSEAQVRAGLDDLVDLGELRRTKAGQYRRAPEGAGPARAREVADPASRSNEGPLVYHGTNREFDKFELRPTFRNIDGRPTEVEPQAIFFSENRDTARMFAEDKQEIDVRLRGLDRGDARVGAYRLNTQRPLDLTVDAEALAFIRAQEGWEHYRNFGEPNHYELERLAWDIFGDPDAAPRTWGEVQAMLDDPRVVSALRAEGYDAVRLREDDGSASWAVFDPEAVAAVDAAAVRGAAISSLPEADPRIGDGSLDPFDDPFSPAALAQADGLLHDMRAAVDAGELEGAAFATGRDGAAEAPDMLLARLDAEDAALKALRGCL